MNKIILFLFIAIFNNAWPQTFSGFIDYLNALPADARQARVDSFMMANDTLPLTEDTLAHFIYSGTGSSLAVPGDFSGWNPVNAFMTNISGTDFWYRTYVFENNARLDYKFVYGGTNWILDPNNPYTIPGGFGYNSELRMPLYEAPAGIELNPAIPHGTIEDTLFFSSFLQNSRQVKVYLPHGYQLSTDDHYLVLVHDGEDYLTYAKMKNVLDYMHANWLIKPTVVVFIPPKDRNPEYIDEKQEAFTSFIVEEIMPWIMGKYRIRPEPSCHAMLGSSAGSNIALWIGMLHPDVIGSIAAFSPYIEPDILNFFAASPMLDLKIYILHGKYDHLGIIQQSVNAFIPILDAKDYQYIFEEQPQGHSFGFWRGFIDDALRLFAPGSGFGLAENPARHDFKMYPNPTHGKLQITISKFQTNSKIQRINVQIMDMYGKVVAIFNPQPGTHNPQPGTRNPQLDISHLPAGLYLVRLTHGTSVHIQKLIID